MRNRKGLLIVLSGPSGSGKGTVLKELLAKNNNLFLSVSATTRSPREGEVHGKHYYFLSKDEFEARIAGDGMLEYASYCGNYYGTPKDAVYEMLNAGKDVILEIEVQGAMQIKERCPDAVFVFVMPPSMNELKHRLTDRRTEDAETVVKRMQAAVDEIRASYQYDYIVVNDTVSEAANTLDEIIRVQKCSTGHMKEFIDEVLEDE